MRPDEIEGAAPDAASLAAARKLARNNAAWAGLGRDPGSDQGDAKGEAVVWGECQGSGAHPYRVAAQLDGGGWTCACPSRKQPCKHVLGLWLRHAADPDAAPETTAPDWVSAWRARRRAPPRATATTQPTKEPGAPNDAGPEADRAPSAARESSAPARGSAERTMAKTDQAIRDGLDDLEQWILDQLRSGLSAFIADPAPRCRRIAARLVDAKSGGLAARIDDLPARLYAHAPERRPEAAAAELGRLTLISRAFRADPTLAEIRREISGAPPREAALADPQTVFEEGLWEVVGASARARRDGLTVLSTWLLRLDAATPRFALVLDHAPSRSAPKAPVFEAGRRVRARLAFYPAARPLRALIAARPQGEGGAEGLRSTAPAAETPLSGWPAGAQGGGDPLAQAAAHLAEAPWPIEAPALLPAGRIGLDDRGGAWWRADAGAAALPLKRAPRDVLFGARIGQMAVLWDGSAAEALAARTDWGWIDAAA